MKWIFHHAATVVLWGLIGQATAEPLFCPHGERLVLWSRSQAAAITAPMHVSQSEIERRFMHEVETGMQRKRELVRYREMQVESEQVANQLFGELRAGAKFDTIALQHKRRNPNGLVDSGFVDPRGANYSAPTVAVTLAVGGIAVVGERHGGWSIIQLTDRRLMTIEEAIANMSYGDTEQLKRNIEKDRRASLAEREEADFIGIFNFISENCRDGDIVGLPTNAQVVGQMCDFSKVIVSSDGRVLCSLKLRQVR